MKRGDVAKARSADGHLFVVHGKIEALRHDAAIIPVDKGLNFTPAWKCLLGTPWPSEPATWDSGWGRIGETDHWLVQVGDGVDDDAYGRVLERLRIAIGDICRTTSSDRELPLIAVPFLGVGEGGHRHRRGAVVDALIGALSEAATNDRVDIALVTPDASVYSAAQYRRRATHAGLPAPLQRLAERAATGSLALFLGAGASIPAGLPSWDGLIARLAEHTDISTKLLQQLGPTDQAELIQQKDETEFAARVCAIVAEAKRPSLLHALLAGLDAHEVVTTNYDLLYEKAAGATGRKVTGVLPWQAVPEADRWILKLHGDVDHEDKIVLTRRHMVMYDAANKPSAALLQSLLLTKHLLFVGVSFTDDNLIRLVHEVEAYRDEHQNGTATGPFATALDPNATRNTAREQLWEGRVEWIPAQETMGVSGYRAQEILLDTVGMYASHDSSWLLDGRFEGMLPEGTDREIANDLGTVTARMRTASPMWKPLIETLKGFGVKD